MLRIVKSKANLLFSPVHCRRILAKEPEVIAPPFKLFRKPEMIV
jgi:hypothetical protein